MFAFFNTIHLPKWCRLKGEDKSSHWHGELSKNTYWEAEVSFCPMDPELRLDMSFSLFGRDHAGIGFELRVLWFRIALDTYDTRHWDYKNNCWCNYDPS